MQAVFKFDDSFANRQEQIRARFEQFHRDNPAVWDLFVRFTMDVINRGHRHYSSDAIVHRIRWHSDVETRGDAVKINNNFTAFYARMFHKLYPQYSGFFLNRIQKSKTEAAHETDVAVFDSGRDYE